MKIDSDNLEKLSSSEWRIHVDESSISFDWERIEHVNLKRQLWKGSTCNIDENVDSGRYQTRGRILFSKLGYANH